MISSAVYFTRIQMNDLHFLTIVCYNFFFVHLKISRKKETINNISTTQRNRKHVDVRERMMFEQAGN